MADRTATVPFNEEAEAKALAAILHDPPCFGDVLRILGPTGARFHNANHAAIWQAMVTVDARREQIDSLAVAQAMSPRDREAAGGVAGLEDLRDLVWTSYSVEHHAQIVAEAATLRSMGGTFRALAAECLAETKSAQTALDKAEGVLAGLLAERNTPSAVHVGAALQDVLEEMDRAAQQTGLRGISTGLRDLDGLLGGLQNGDLVVVAARPNIGKTAFALHLCQAAVSGRVPCTLFSLEMRRNEILQRMLASAARVPLAALRDPRRMMAVQRESIVAAARRLQDAPLTINDASKLTVLDVRTDARRQATQMGKGLVIVDYLTLITPATRRENRYQEIGDTTRALKALARELNCPVVVLAQLGRNAERESDPFKKQSYLRESGDVEQDADIVMILEEPAADGIERNQADELTVCVSKHRNGPRGILQVYYDRRTQHIGDLATPERTPPAANQYAPIQSAFNEDEVPF